MPGKCSIIQENPDNYCLKLYAHYRIILRRRSSTMDTSTIKDVSKDTNTEIAIINKENIKDKIYEIRGQQVMLDSDLAEIYGYTTKALNQQVKNNIDRFDEEYLRFQLTDEEVGYLRSKNFTANISAKSRSNPYAFTEQGISH